MPETYLLTVKTEHCRSLVRINGVDVIRTAAEDASVTGGSNVTRWIMPGVNQLEIHLPMGPDDSRLATHFEASVDFLEEGQSPAQARSLAQLIWPLPGMDELRPVVEVQEFEPPLPLRSRFWGRASPIEGNDATRALLADMARELHRMFESGNRIGLSRQLAYKAEDYGLMFGMTPDESVQSQDDFLEMVMDDPDFQALPMEPDSFRYKIVAGGLVARVSRDGAFLLQTQKTQAIDVYLGCVDGQWCVVR